MNTYDPSIKDIDRLIAYLPRLYSPGFKPFKDRSNDEIEQPMFRNVRDYDELVKEFFCAAADDCWLDTDYLKNIDAMAPVDDEFFKTASINQLKTILTYCCRQQRFIDGHWAMMIESGIVQKVLERLISIRSEMQLFTQDGESGSNM